MIYGEAFDIAEETLSLLRSQSRRIATAESCTGGLIGGTLTAVPGSSDVVDRGFITYTNEAKHAMLGVPMNHFDTVGAVSEEVADAMAKGAIENSVADIAVAVTGVAGPGQSERKPAGLVYIGCAVRNGPVIVEKHQFSGDRGDVRLATVLGALRLVQRQAAQVPEASH